ncbi:hypothetical protein ACA910_020265 [Epithemia clementina (nom. ined.)]
MMMTTSTTTTDSASTPHLPSTNISPQNQKIEWNVRPATPDDAEAVNEVLRTSYSEVMRPDYDEELLMKAVPHMSTARETLLTCGTWYVVEHPTTKQIVGCGGWTAEAPKVESLAVSESSAGEQLVPHLRHFACHPQWTRCGVARAIWNRTWKEVSERFGSDTSMEVFSTITAVPFYGSMGFKVSKQIEIPLDGKSIMFPAVLMRREPKETQQ